jgi:tRNA(Ile)-lysidine synthase TilS/MesJ
MNTACINPNMPIVLGYSNGPDSRYLLEQLHTQFPQISICLLYCHHGLRDDADTEALDTMEIAKEKGVDCIIKHLPLANYKKKWGVSEEMAGHFLRKSMFIHYAKLRSAQVCTGHHANDAAENHILKTERGRKDGAEGLHYDYIQ